MPETVRNLQREDIQQEPLAGQEYHGFSRSEQEHFSHSPRLHPPFLLAAADCTRLLQINYPCLATVDLRVESLVCGRHGCI